MINREKLVLVECTPEEFRRYKGLLGLRDLEKEDISKDGFARIKKPLKYKSFEFLLHDFGETPYARRVSVRTVKRWDNVGVQDLTEEEIKRLSQLARQRGSLYLQFRSRTKDMTNEIGFRLLDNSKVISNRLHVPAEQKTHYDWTGNHRYYNHVWGIYVPRDSIIPLIFFGCSIGTSNDFASRQELVDLRDAVKELGYELASEQQTQEGAVVEKKIMSDLDIHDRDYQWLRDSNVGVFEISNPGTGGEISDMVNLGKPVVCLHKKGLERIASSYIKGKKGSRFIRTPFEVFAYESVEEAQTRVKNFVENRFL